MTVSIAVAVTAALQVALVVVIATRRGSRPGTPEAPASDLAEYRAPTDEEMPAASERRSLFGSPTGPDPSRR